MTRLLPLAALLLTLAACSDSPTGPDPPDVPTITGDWEGIVISGSDTLAAAVTFNEAGGLVDGSGTIQRPGESLAFILEGTYAHPLLSLQMVFDRPPPGTLSGTVSADRDRITGTLSAPTNISGTVDLMLQLQMVRPAR